jgi:hypothetical protein
MEEYERCTGMKHLYLTSEGLHAGKEILESFLFCMYLGSFTLPPLHKAKWVQLNGKTLQVLKNSLHAGEKGYMVVATAFSYGEDVTPRGYIRYHSYITLALVFSRIFWESFFFLLY